MPLTMAWMLQLTSEDASGVANPPSLATIKPSLTEYEAGRGELKGQSPKQTTTT